MMRFLSFILLMILFFSCETGQMTSTPTELEGVWVYKGYQYGPGHAGTPAGMPGCEKETENVTLEITRKNNRLEISGRSFINTYFSTAEVSFERTDQSGTIAFEGIGTTKMGGPENLMQCETVYYELLRNATIVKIENQRLYLGREQRPIDSRLHETLIFEKKKI